MKNTTTTHNEAIDQIIAAIPSESEMHDVFFAIAKMKERADQYAIDCHNESAWGKLMEEHQYAFLHINMIFDAFRKFQHADYTNATAKEPESVAKDSRSAQPSYEELLQENEQLRARLEEFEKMDLHLVKKWNLYIKVDLEEAYYCQKALRELISYVDAANFPINNSLLFNAMRALDWISPDLEMVRNYFNFSQRKVEV